MTALCVVFAGLFGAAGVAGAALAAHGGETRLVAIAAAMALVHAPALLSLTAVMARAPRSAGFAGIAMIVGILLFCGDLAMRFATGTRLFPDAAPIGGSVLIAAWVAVVVTGLLMVFRPRSATARP